MCIIIAIKNFLSGGKELIMILRKLASLFVLTSVLLSVCAPAFALYASPPPRHPPMSRHERERERRERDYYEERRLDRMREEQEIRERARRDQMRWERQRDERERREWDRREQARYHQEREQSAQKSSCFDHNDPPWSIRRLRRKYININFTFFTSVCQ